MVREALASLLGLEEDIEVVAQVDRGDAVLAAARESRPDVALLDIEMPGADGIEAARQLTNEMPACAGLILTTLCPPGAVRRAMESGARGFLLKDAPAKELAVAIRRTVAGDRVVDPALAAQALSEGKGPLSWREREVLIASAAGNTIAEIAGALHLTQGTERNHNSAAITKHGARNRFEAARAAEGK